MEDLPERPIDQLRRHETSLTLLEEHADEQLLVNKGLQEKYDRLADEIRNLRESYASDQRVWRLGIQTMRVLGKWGIYVGAAAVGWAYSHWDKLLALHASEK